MRFLKYIINGLLCFILCNIIIGISLVACLKYMLDHHLLKEGFKQILVQDVRITDDSEKSKKINEILQDEKTNVIMEKVFDDYMNSFDGNQKELSEDTVNSIIDFIKTHKSELESISGETIDIDEVSNELKKQELFSLDKLNGDKKIMDNAGDIQALKIYKLLTTKKTLYICIAAIIVILTIYALMNRSYTIWIKPIGSSILTAGILVLIAKYLLSKVLVDYPSIDLNYLLYVGVSEIVIGILIMILYKVVENKRREINNTNINDITYFNNINTN